MTIQNAPKRIIVLGALSAIARATCRKFAERGSEFILVGRDAERLQQVADDLRARGSEDCKIWPLDLVNVEDPNEEIRKMSSDMTGTIDAVLLFYGDLGDNERAERDISTLRKAISVNFASAAEWCVAAASVLEEQDSGVLMAISSVAGDRGRQSNYVYGAAKAGLTVLVEGIAHRLAKTKSRAVVVKLGFVDTPMTAHIPKKGFLWSQPEAIADRLYQLATHPSPPVVYVPWFWQAIMFVLRHLPTWLFHRSNL